MGHPLVSPGHNHHRPSHNVKTGKGKSKGCPWIIESAGILEGLPGFLEGCPCLVGVLSCRRLAGVSLCAVRSGASASPKFIFNMSFLAANISFPLPLFRFGPMWEAPCRLSEGKVHGLGVRCLRNKRPSPLARWWRAPAPQISMLMRNIAQGGPRICEINAHFC